MSQPSIRVCIVLLFGLWVNQTLFAQGFSTKNGETSPYSRFGIGETRTGVQAMFRGMGQVTTAYQDPFTVNFSNPASYSFLKLTTYEAGGMASSRTILSDQQVYRTGMASLSHLNLGIPLGESLGMSFGLRPMSRMYYLFNDTTQWEGLGKVISSDTGQGSVNFGFLGLAGKWKGLSLGANLGYVFGSLYQTQALVGVDTIRYPSAVFGQSLSIGSFYYELGALYQLEWKEDMRLRIGATARLTQDLEAKETAYWYSRSAILNGAIHDTAYRQPGTEGQVVMPARYSLGIQWEKDQQWLVGLDYQWTQWKEFRRMGEVDSFSDQTMKVGIGLAYTPDAKSINAYWERVTYRIGGYWGTYPIRLQNTDMNCYAFTAGLSLPFKRSTDRIHLGMEWGSLGTQQNGLTRERFFKFSLGISLNDRWFIQRKYD